jgi:dolichol-phosphate mannosyltransferase
LDISIILPTYCECGNISQLISAIEENLSALNQQVEIIVVDDNSPDCTAEVVRQLMPLPGFTIRCLVRVNERGLATAIKHGILHASGDRIVVMDTDFNHSPDNLITLVTLLNDNDMVIGSRFVQGGGMEDRFRYCASLFFNLFIQLILWSPVRDSLCGFFAMRRETLLALDLKTIFSGYGEYFIRLVFFARQNGLKIKEIPVFYTLRKTGESKSNFTSMIADYSRTTFKLLRTKHQR